MGKSPLDAFRAGEKQKRQVHHKKADGAQDDTPTRTSAGFPHIEALLDNMDSQHALARWQHLAQHAEQLRQTANSAREKGSLQKITQAIDKVGQLLAHLYELKHNMEHKPSKGET